MGQICVSAAKKSRSPVVAGLFYPEEKEAVENQLCSFGLTRGTGTNALAVIAPHGAWNLSGRVAAAAFSPAPGTENHQNKAITRVIILGPIHAAGEEGVFFSDSAFFKTPLGKIPVDLPLSAELASCSTYFEINDIPHLKEHSAEVLLPLVKFCFPQASIVPILIGGTKPSLLSALARALWLVLGPLMDHTLLVVSTGLSKNQDEKTALAQAEEFIGLLRKKNQETLTAGIYDRRISACGGALAAVALQSGLLDDTRVSVTPAHPVIARGDEGQIVYYGAVAFSGDEAPRPQEPW
ncbi:MAG: AmmeMemoRadiSam system protein B [Spirochaetaceae bacterium]|jgi:AmmeMemoRadiSam system protein B|nr:AmmeMemoRadiSam system protein B [Spirochaetaceae bacterium]